MSEPQIQLHTHAPPPEAVPGRAIDDGVRTRFERAFGADLASVRVHEDGLAAARGAEAIADGEHLHFRPGAYAPGTAAGDELLGHELAHVMQQRAGRVGQPQHRGGVMVDAALEAEADRLGAMAARGERAPMPGSERPGADRRDLALPKMSVSVVAGDGDDPAAVRVQRVDIAGRPERKKFKRDGGGSTEGDHTTAWAVMRLGVYNRIVGRTLAEAVDQVDALLVEAKRLPGASRAATDIDRQNFTNRALSDAAERGRAARSALGGRASAAQSALQQYIAMYLEYRNSLPLSVMDRGRATGDGEPTLLKVAQYWEQSWTDEKVPTRHEKRDLLCALGALFSPDVANELGDADHQNMPGVAAREGERSIANALRDQHHQSLESAFPNLASRLDLSEVDPGNAWTGTVPDDAANVNTGAPFGIQLVIDGAGRISRVIASGRPKHGTVGSLEGDHTTAYIVSVRTIEGVCIGKNLAGATAALTEVENEFRAMPGAQPLRADEMSEERIAHFLHSSKLAEDARKAARRAPTLSSVQTYASALLYYRNSMALTVVAAETTSVGKGEARRMSRLEQLDVKMAQRQRVKASDLLEAVAGLFDRAAIDKVIGVVHQNAGLVEDYHIGEVDVAPNELDSKQKDKQKKRMDIDDLPEGFNLEKLGTQDVMVEFDADEVAANSRKDKAPGYQRGESEVELFTALLEQHLRALKLAAPFAFGGLDDNVTAAMIAQLLGDTAIEVDEILGRLSGVLTGTHVRLVTNDLAAVKAEKEQAQRKKQRTAKVDWFADDEDYLSG